METITDIVREMREKAQEDGYTPDGLLGQSLNYFADRIEAAYKREIETLTADRDNWLRQALAEDECANAAETVTDCNALNGAKTRETDDWRCQLERLINGEVSHYMSQDTDYFSVDCGPWSIKYDNTNGEDK